jgi:hypothetical protein
MNMSRAPKEFGTDAGRLNRELMHRLEALAEAKRVKVEEQAKLDADTPGNNVGQ